MKEQEQEMLMGRRAQYSSILGVGDGEDVPLDGTLQSSMCRSIPVLRAADV